MIELLCVIIIVGSLSASALPQFVDFRKEARAAALRQTLVAIRVGMKNSRFKIMLNCGGVASDTVKITLPNLFANDITSSGAVMGSCTTAQVPDPADRKIWSVSGDGSQSNFPENPLWPLSKNTNGTGATWGHTQGCGAFGPGTAWDGNHCGLAELLKEVLGNYTDWAIDSCTGYVFAASNTPGINECNF